MTTKLGQVQGKSLKCGLTCKYFGFKGIPYAEPPVGELRFRNPIPHRGWEGVRDASEHGNVCLTNGIPLGLRGSEDCLFLNVYVHKLGGNKPVMVWIHGGGFDSQSGNSWVYGMENFVTQDIVVVSINYRLGALGFFSTGDKYASGNWGMKDQVLALKWVQENIEAFGGNPHDVTIFGESAGGASINFLLLSKMARGLFSKAISNSGTSLVPWGYQHDPEAVKEIVAEHYGFSKDSQVLIEELRKLNASRFVEVQPGYSDIPVPRGLRPFNFVPVVEPEDAEEPFLTEVPFKIMQSGDFTQVPYMMGYNSRESLFMIREFLIDSKIMDKFNENPHLLVPLAWNIEEGSEASKAVSTAFQNLYWGGGNATTDKKPEWVTYMTDHQFIYGIDKSVQVMSHMSKEPVYYYQFSYDGDFNILKRLLLLSSYEGAMHGDDVFYLFEVSNSPVYPILPTSHARTVKKRMIKMWGNFVKYGEPTPFKETLLQNVKWGPVKATQEHLDIGEDLVFGRYPNKDRLALWKHLEENYAEDIFNH